jgi:16S rRNA (guanine(966)-N(2))-methyltransferase RsmD
MRVIAGRFRGAAIRVPRGEKVRPTYDRVRESVFAILEPQLEGARVLDLFAGSGSLGIESVSRGAARATFVEIDPGVMSVLSGNVDRLGLADAAPLIRGDALSALRGALPGGPFDVVFIDPPYSSELALRSLELLSASRHLAESGLAIVERDAGRELPEAVGRLERFRTRKYGSTAVDFYRARAAGAETEEDS